MLRVIGEILHRPAPRVGFGAACLGVLRNVRLVMAERPGTVLRVMCIMAFDVLSMLRGAGALSLEARRRVAALLDFGAALNAELDGKGEAAEEIKATWGLLQEGAMGAWMGEYRRRLTALERQRPAAGGDGARPGEVQRYREAVVRLSLGMVAVGAELERSLDGGIEATRLDAELNVLFRIVMLCQIVDDVLDYAEDGRAGLPSFMTGSGALRESVELARLAARGYWRDGEDAGGGALVWRAALWLTGLCAMVTLGWRRTFHGGRQRV